jgi:putative addiction module component (TIGR02574 family)
MLMSANLATILAAAESLSVPERRELIALLLEGLDEHPEAEEGPPHLTEAWRQEIARRSAEYDAGQAETLSWEASLIGDLLENNLSFRALVEKSRSSPRKDFLADNEG